MKNGKIIVIRTIRTEKITNYTMINNNYLEIEKVMIMSVNLFMNTLSSKIHIT